MMALLLPVLVSIAVALLGGLVMWLWNGFFGLRPRSIRRYGPSGPVTWMDAGSGGAGLGGEVSGDGGSFGGGGASGHW
jgi:hypothetical protein